MSSKYRIIPLGGGGMDPSTKYGASISMSMDQDYILSVQLLDQDGNALGSEQTVDLPLESVVVGGSYDSATKSLILTLDNGNTVTIPVGDLVSGLQTEITAQNPLSADLVADGTTNKVFTAAEQTKLSGIETGAQANVKPDWNAAAGTAAEILNKPTIPDATSDLTNDSGFITANDIPAQEQADWNETDTTDPAFIKNKPTIPAAQVNADWNASTGVAQILNKPTLGTMAAESSSDYTKTSGLAAVATSGNYNDLTNKPTIPDAVSGVNDGTNWTSITIGSVTKGIPNGGGGVAQVQSDWTQTDTTAVDYIKHKPTIPSATSDLTNDSGFITSSDIPAQVNSDWNAVSGAAQILNKPTIPTVNDATLTIQKNSTTVGTFTANQATAETINITVPTSAADVSALPASTKYAAAMTLSVNTTTYVVTAQLKDQDGNNLGTAQTIDLPLESVVVNGTYDSTNKKIILTLQSGSTIDIPVADLVAGLQSTIDAQHPLNADYLTSGTTNKVYTATEQTKLSGIEAGAQVNVKPDWNAASGTAAEILNKPTIPTTTSQLTNNSGFITASDNTTFTGDCEFTNPLSCDGAITVSETAELGPGQTITTTTTIDIGQVGVEETDGTDFISSYINAGSISLTDAGNNAASLSTTTIAIVDNVHNMTSITAAGIDINGNSVVTSDQLATVATTGDYTDLTNTPTIPAAQVNSDWNSASGVSQILNKPSTVAVVVTFTDQTTATYNLYHS